jgi:hypothetical protein
MKPFRCILVVGIFASFGCDSTAIGGGAHGGHAGGADDHGPGTGGGSAGAAGGRGGGAGGQEGGTTGTGETHSCGPSSSCPSCTTGACCGTACCGPGEWCDLSGVTPLCRCWSNAGCTDGNICAQGGVPISDPAACGITCCGGPGRSNCPLSRRDFKRDIERLGQDDLARIYDELRKLQLSTYRYKAEASGTPRHLGFIIDDTKTPYPINADGMSVDLYGYLSMSVAAIQIQSREIEALRAEVAALRGAKPRPANRATAPLSK